MKIIFLYGSDSRNSGGLYNSVRMLGQSLIKIKGIEVVALAHHDEYSAVDLPAYASLQVETYHIKGPANFGFSSDLKNKISEINPDIIHPQCNWMYLSYINLEYHKKHNTPYIISPRGMLDEWILQNGSFKKKIAGLLYEKEHLKKAACIHALSISDYNSIRKFGCKNPVALIPNGVNLPIDNTIDKNDLSSWKYNDGRKSLLFLSRLHPKKGLENLITAWSKIKNRKEWKLLIAGESSDKNYLQSLYDLQIKSGMKNDVFFIGPQFHKEKDICFRSVDAFILPSFSEGLPMAVLEAWSYKLPALITEQCNLPEGFEKNAAIKIIADPESITMQLNKFFDMNENERKQIGINGYELVKEKFTWSSVAAQMNDIYKWILNGGAAPSTIMFN
jgi:glycosyltransferase involved in cell wall biosynthesis